MWLFLKNQLIDLKGSDIRLVEADTVTKKGAHVVIGTLRGSIHKINCGYPKVLFDMIQDHFNQGATALKITKKILQEKYDATEHVDTLEE